MSDVFPRFAAFFPAHISTLGPDLAVLVLVLVFILPAVAWAWGRFRYRQKRRQLWQRHRDLATLRALSWQEFERLTGEVFRRQGFCVKETGGGGADDGADLILERQGRRYLVQCKHYKRGSVGAPLVREMIGAAIHWQAKGVYIVTCGTFSKKARAYAEGKPVHLIDGEALCALIARQRGEGL